MGATRKLIRLRSLSLITMHKNWVLHDYYTMATPERIAQSMSLVEKRSKIKSNYETIEILKKRLEENRRKESAGMNRAAYVKMIFDATTKVDKQNEELSKAILDTRHLQRDINNLSGRLERSFTLVEANILKVSDNLFNYR